MPNISKPNVQDNTRFSNRYILTETQVNMLTHGLSSIGQAFLDFLLAGGAIDYINSVMVYPFDLVAGKSSNQYTDEDSIMISWETISKTMIGSEPIYRMNDNYDCSFNIGRIYVAPVWNDVRDYSVKLELFLPFYGFVELKMADFLRHWIDVTYIVSFSTGTALIVIKKVSNVDNTSVIMSTYETQIGVKMPIGGPLISEEQVANTIKLAVGAMIAGATGATMSSGTSTTTSVASAKTIKYTKRNPDTGRQVTTRQVKVPESYRETKSVSHKPPMDLGRQIVDSVVANDHYRGLSSGSGLPWLYMPTQIYIVLTYNKPSIPENYKSLYGRPSNKTADRIGTLMGGGFTSFSNLHMEGFLTATGDEISEIEEMLTNGVIL